jgi:transposase
MQIKIPSWLSSTKTIDANNCIDIYKECLGEKLGIKKVKHLSYKQLKIEAKKAKVENCLDYDKKRKSNWPSNPRDFYEEWDGWDSFLDRPKKKILSKKELMKMIQEKSTVKIAKECGVASTTVFKWTKLYKIKTKPKGYWQGLKTKMKMPSKRTLAKMINEKSTIKIAEHYKVADSTVLKWIKDYKIKTKPKGYWITNNKKYTRPSKIELAKMMNKKSLAKIAEHYGVSKFTITKLARSYKIKPKPKGYWVTKHKKPSKIELAKILKENSINKTAKHYEVSAYTVTSWAESYGIKGKT